MNNRLKIFGLIVLVAVLFIMELRYGKFSVKLNDFIDFLFGKELDAKNGIILSSRLIRATTAVIAGASLSLAGLIMQTYFRNALAGPSVLGISSGASLSVALLTLLSGSVLGISTSGLGFSLWVSFAAMIGAGVILFLISILSAFIKNSVSLLILGLMIGYLTSAIIGVLQFNASEASLKAFIIWGMGSFDHTEGYGLLVMGGTLLLAAVLVLLIFKHLNVLLLGEQYAQSMGVPVKKVKLIMIIITGILVGVVTAFCGPIAFLGLAVPHLCRALFKTSNHKLLVPGVILLGISLGLACDLISRSPWYEGGLPLNTVTSLIGAPVVIFYLFRKNKIGEMV